MRHALARSLLSLVALVAACTGLGASPEVPTDPEPSTAVPVPVVTVPDATPSDADPPDAEDPPDVASPLHVVAAREGQIELIRAGDRLVTVLDGEPLLLRNGMPARGRDGSRGLGSSNISVYESPPLAFAGSLEPSKTAWLSTAEHFERSASVYRVYRNRNRGQGWELLDLRKGPLIAYYAAFVERNGALLGLRSWGNDPEQDVFQFEEPGSDAYARAAKRAMARASHGFVKLAGAKTAVPKVPAGARPFAAVGGSDGTLYALAREHGKGGDETVVLLVWPPSATTAKRVALPGVKAPEVSLTSSGEWALVFGVDYDGEGGGRTSYLATGRGTEWQAVPVTTTKTPHPDDPVTIAGAARADDGALWITIGERWIAGRVHPLWRKPSDGAWAEVPLPTLEGWFPSDGTTVFDAWNASTDPWLEVSRPQGPGALRGKALVWAEGTVWAVIEIGHSYDDDAALFSESPRSLLVSTRPATTAPVTLPSSAQLLLEQYNGLRAGAKPGQRTCEDFTLVLGPASLADQQPQLVAAVAALATTSGDWQITQVYVGELDDAPVLAVAARVTFESSVAELRSAVTKVMGVEPTLDCRVPTLERIVHDP